MAVLNDWIKTSHMGLSRLQAQGAHLYKGDLRGTALDRARIPRHLAACEKCLWYSNVSIPSLCYRMHRLVLAFSALSDIWVGAVVHSMPRPLDYLDCAPQLSRALTIGLDLVNGCIHVWNSQGEMAQSLTYIV